MLIKKGLILCFLSFIFYGCDADINDHESATCLWYENINGEFINVKTTKCAAPIAGSIKDEYQKIKGSIYLVNSNTYYQSCGFYQSCQVQKIHYFRVSDASNFTTLGKGYAIVGEKIYYKGREIQGASPQSFRVMNDLYSKDDDQVYYQGVAILLADPHSFELLPENYSKDQQHVYFETNLVKGADPQTFAHQSSEFQGLKWHFDQNNFYYFDQKIPIELDKNSFRLITNTASNSALYADQQYAILITTYYDHNKYPKDHDQCLNYNDSYFIDNCLEDLTKYHRFVQSQDLVVEPSGSYNVLGIRYLKNIQLPLKNFTDSAFFDANGSLFHIENGSLKQLPHWVEGKIHLIPVECILPDNYYIDFDCPNEKERQFNRPSLILDFFEDDTAIYAMATETYDGIIYDIKKISDKTVEPIYLFSLKANHQYLAQGNLLSTFKVDFDTNKIQIKSVEIDGSLQGLFRGYSTDRKIIDASGIIDIGSLERSYAKADFGVLKYSDKSRKVRGGKVYENEAYFFILFPEDSSGNSSYVINKENGQARYLFNINQSDITDIVSAGLLEVLGIERKVEIQEPQ
ncbi:DKNYY domain-containing protein [Ignatzschineria rhizosphaerae]|uniref:DKNYY domain-containing protein n=1 Tax=Ignatzschineria rhizosphaerae TaxID=2923279 RepID=A0ABY3X5H8_9GAMM|nr:DKNYY domain-containing protein [Ignatzschineria rhizosphaerae]UNM97150.1 DKNYY domain-containing protein [Ignatzschineria rhizosphaerae]